jgi:hypothetical protein
MTDLLASERLQVQVAHAVVLLLQQRHTLIRQVVKQLVLARLQPLLIICDVVYQPGVFILLPGQRRAGRPSLGVTSAGGSAGVSSGRDRAATMSQVRRGSHAPAWWVGGGSLRWRDRLPVRERLASCGGVALTSCFT